MAAAREQQRQNRRETSASCSLWRMASALGGDALSLEHRDRRMTASPGISDINENRE